MKVHDKKKRHDFETKIWSTTESEIKHTDTGRGVKCEKPILSDEIAIGSALVNLKKMNIKMNDKVKKINPKERKILEKMLELPGKIFSRDDIGKIISIPKVEEGIKKVAPSIAKKYENCPSCKKRKECVGRKDS